MTVNQQPAGRGPGDRDRLAVALKQARQAAGLTGVEAARAAGFGQSKLSKIERMVLLPSAADVEALSRVYALPSGERDALARLAVGLREEQSAKVILARRVGELQRRVRQLEASAMTIRAFQPVMVLGLFQTDAYSRCVFGQPDSQRLDDDQIDEAVEERTGRQPIVSDESKDIRLIMTEGALRWQAGSAVLMAAQVDAIAHALVRGNVNLGIIPWTQPVLLFPRHGFQIYDQDAVMVGTETATATMTGAADIATYLELFTALEEIAAYGDDAREHLTRISAEYRRLAAA
ncbi:MAG: helix-turn-helix domain-containing protein [Nitriliruptorales bacterium]|nr:helix-turn-helix domain-containing protein [Nitriliruptorales bacterium]